MTTQVVKIEQQSLCLRALKYQHFHFEGPEIYHGIPLSAYRQTEVSSLRDI